jgi:RimJ/RimL family protein N-acetyltransferase
LSALFGNGTHDLGLSSLVGCTVVANLASQRVLQKVGGLATEIASALLGMARTDLGLSSLVSCTVVANLASQRVLQKVGFSFERALDYQGESCVLYRVHCPPMLSDEHRAPSDAPKTRQPL